ncbi:hypothetical protein EDD37DRAFT_378960 [Exophiala viscosa]|uniref:Cyclase n=1 Tax=Exophiala viscosa TaxID=2486360 RepID=A0AAN6IA16_9EURO|nr:hypothetical protein EDD36DRAFT_444895 [Exophiala viscosa]KAI1625141.1 hypothetical protein EDD37DRAFT_378960 [Exophiala viscosa]
MKLDSSSQSLPKRSELPKIDGAPDGAAWFWGQDDELGRLNMLTTGRTASAAKLIKTGEIVNLNWPAEFPNPPAFGRQGFKHTIQPIGPSGFDDLYDMNTQSGSQWDGFRHVGLPHNGKIIFYNGLVADDIYKAESGGMQAWADHGIAGRGVLIDYWDYAGKSYDPITTHRITLSDIHAIAKKHGIEFQYGDILIIRSGFTENYVSLDEKQRAHLGTLKIPEHAFVGVEQTEDMLDFLHDNYFSAVVGDAPAFEAWPRQSINLHQYLLTRWGVPIGEMWDLDQLAETCKRKNQYAFFVASVPTNVRGGVGSHPNAIAIF